MAKQNMFNCERLFIEKKKVNKRNNNLQKMKMKRWNKEKHLQKEGRKIIGKSKKIKDRKRKNKLRKSDKDEATMKNKQEE